MKSNATVTSIKVISCLFWLLAGAAGLSGCAAPTQVINSWKSPQASPQNYTNIVVAAMSDDLLVRETIEAKLQNQLRMQGIKATKSIDLFPPTVDSEQSPDPDKMLQRIQGDGYDGILTVAVVDEETETRYVPGGVGYTPLTRFGWYNTFRGYYGYYSPTLYQPGYYTKDKIYFLESNLYKADTENLVWSAQSKSYDPATLETFSESFAEVTIKQMVQDNIIQ
ncbi:YajG family lipoprotein [Pontibacter sp. CAU 1760]